MAGREFDLIERFFCRQGSPRQDVVLGIGDDAALLNVPAGKVLVVAVDTLVAGVHFPLDTPAADIAYKSLAVNLSDLAAMGATPAWATLALTLPNYDEAWLADFAAGFFALADQHNVALVGGDTTRGPLTITVQLQGWVEAQYALRRDGARAGDLIYVSGAIGDAGLGLLAWQEKLFLQPDNAQFLKQRLARPTARVALGQALRGVANAAIDISDGLAADLGHILERSRVGAEVVLSAVPLSPAFRQSRSVLTNFLQQPIEDIDIFFALRAGDDYELCFTVAPDKQDDVARIGREYGIPLTPIGRVTTQQGLFLVDGQGKRQPLVADGYQHF